MVALRQTVAPSFSWLHERYPQRFVMAHKMIVRAPPFYIDQQVWRLLSRRPGSMSKGCHSMSDRQIHPLDKSGIEQTVDQLASVPY